MAASKAPDEITDEVSRTLWVATKEILVAEGRWDDSFAGLVTRYVRALELERKCREQRDGKVTGTGYKGQDVAHPLLRVEREATRDANEYARELLLTPKARRQAEMESGKKPPKGGGKFGL